MNRWNINVILCRSCDKQVSNIKGVFDSIRVNGIASFYIVTFINGIDTTNLLSLHYCLDCISNKKRAYIGKIDMEIHGEACYGDGNSKKGTTNRCVSDMLCRKIDRIEFPQSGDYELKVFGFVDEDKIKDLSNKEEQDIVKEFDNSSLMVTYPFQVKLIN